MYNRGFTSFDANDSVNLEVPAGQHKRVMAKINKKTV
jgi:hypothetical protein